MITIFVLICIPKVTKLWIVTEYNLGSDLWAERSLLFPLNFTFFSGKTRVLREVPNCELGVRFLEESMQCLHGEELVQALNKTGNSNGGFSAVSFREGLSVLLHLIVKPWFSERLSKNFWESRTSEVHQKHITESLI